MVACATRVAELGPPSLWIDDSWNALVYKADTLKEIWRSGITAPGFAFALKGWLVMTGFSETKAQLPSFLIGAITPGVLYLLLIKRRLSRGAALLAGCLVLTSPYHAIYSTRVKWYTLDALATTVVIVGALWVLERPRTSRRVWWFAGIATITTFFGTPTAIVSAGCFASIALANALEGLKAHGVRGMLGSVKVPLIAATAYGFVATVFYLLLIRPLIDERLVNFWRGHYIDVTQPSGKVISEVWDRVLDLLMKMMSVPPRPQAFLWCGVLIALLIFRRRTLPIFVLPILGALTLAALRLAPLGVRTDIYLYPLFAVALGLAIDSTVGRVEVVGLAVAGAITVWLVASSPDLPEYPGQPTRFLVQGFDQTADPADGLLVYPSLEKQFALYTKLPVDIDKPKGYPNIRPLIRHRTVFQFDQPPFQPLEFHNVIESAMSRHDTLWLMAGRPRRNEIEKIENFLARNGYVRDLQLGFGNSSLTRWQRQ